VMPGLRLFKYVLYGSGIIIAEGGGVRSCGIICAGDRIPLPVLAGPGSMSSSAKGSGASLL